MTIYQELINCRNFDVAQSNLSLWVFKKSKKGGFSAKSVEITVALNQELKQIVSANLGAHTEVEDYTLIAQRNEVSCLHVGTDETSFPDLAAVVDLPAEEHLISTDRDLRNVFGYLIRLRYSNKVIYCVKRVSSEWQTRKAKTVINVVMRAHQLDVVQDRSFTISKSIDFIVSENNVFILNKKHFETLLGYKVEHVNAFAALLQEPAFAERFADMAELVTHIGTNAMHLRRMAIIQQKQHFADDGYMARLKLVNAQQGWNIQFDEEGRIVPTAESMRAIMQVLLNHRLYSQLSLNTFDVAESAEVH